jgi:hypothetical protein
VHAGEPYTIMVHWQLWHKLCNTFRNAEIFKFYFSERSIFLVKEMKKVVKNIQEFLKKKEI